MRIVGIRKIWDNFRSQLHLIKWGSLKRTIIDDVTVLGGFRRKTVPHGKDAASHLRGTEVPVPPPGAATAPRPCIDLYKLTPIPPLRNYRKPAWVQD